MHVENYLFHSGQLVASLSNINECFLFVNESWYIGDVEGGRGTKWIQIWKDEKVFMRVMIMC